MPKAKEFEITKGTLLIANAMLQDPNFKRTVVLVCEHNENGTFGLILNRPLDLRLEDVIEDFGEWDAPLWLGGPVQTNTLHVIHRLGDRIEGSQEVIDGVFWGGDYEEIRELVRLKTVSTAELKFFLGYSGWGPGQLDDEMRSGSWYLSKATAQTVFTEPPEKLWGRVLRAKGGDYAYIANFPEDPRLN
ncbi:MAG: YqgE/AlgH family protein [Chloroherpetonaceae bacterium]|nr:YqgE/AlgH family protein [Chloroherpetonaceae bacterium]MCS7210226.1 YqgE/AlgH family protein [Chloroherpetonaceae bacterium]MDW8019249.1 YqgE/AlgH family protein [Chloroherpetonaceae bacterium]MDW8467502.1 YqgE/AlgH family protein [Chloroherpetonaceae bacterium]